MKILVEILHPAHVHFFRNAIAYWKGRGDEVLVLSRQKECANDLLDGYGIPYESISTLGGSKISLLAEMAVRDWRMWRAARKFKPDVLVGIMGVTIAQVGKLIRKPALVFYDTENAALTNRVVYPLAHSVCTPVSYQGKVNGNHVTYPGYHELAYLHPNRFTPDPEIVRAAGLDPDEPYFIVRLVSWQASHDIGEEGLSSDFMESLMALLARYGRVLISSEGALPKQLESYRFTFKTEDMHHFMAFSRMLIGESATMASEAAVLGVPAFFISDTGRGYTDEQEEKYQLTFNYRRKDAPEALERIEKLLDNKSLASIFQTRREKMLQERIDTTSWLIDYVDKVASPNQV